MQCYTMRYQFSKGAKEGEKAGTHKMFEIKDIWSRRNNFILAFWHLYTFVCVCCTYYIRWNCVCGGTSVEKTTFGLGFLRNSHGAPSIIICTKIITPHTRKPNTIRFRQRDRNSRDTYRQIPSLRGYYT